MTNTVRILATECIDAGEGIKTLEERAKACMKVAHNHWLVTNEAEQLKGAVAAIGFLSSEEENERIDASLRLYTSVAAAMSGIPVDFSQITEIKLLPIMKWWNETKG